MLCDRSIPGLDECIAFAGLCSFDFGKLVETDRSVGGLGLWRRAGNSMHVSLAEKPLLGEKLTYSFFLAQQAWKTLPRRLFRSKTGASTGMSFSRRWIWMMRIWILRVRSRTTGL